MSNIEYVQSVLLGHFCGDAAGASLEFYRGIIDTSKADNAMRMPGGGQLNIGPGQITDDGELTICLYNTLTSASGNQIPLDEIAKSYISWFNSRPFDYGMTCAKAFGMMTSYAGYNGDTIGIDMIRNSKKVNITSEANGALMRISPIALWGVKMGHTDNEIASNAKLDAMLSHPSEVCQDVNAIYCVALANIIKHKHNYTNMLSELDKFIMSNSFNTKVLEWYSEAKNMQSLDSLKSINCRINIGHVKYAFIMAMFFVHKGNNITYEDGIRQVLMNGGDTDTNAAICGAILGAIHGTSGSYGIPKYMLNPVLKFDCTSFDVQKHLMGYNRPKYYHVAQLIIDKC